MSDIFFEGNPSSIKAQRKLIVEKVKALLSDKKKEAVINEYKTLIDELTQIDEREREYDKRV